MNILVAGAGHGGLVAAALLARAGHSVTVYERGERASLGHDWHDTMMPAAFDFCGIPRPAGLFTPYIKARHRNPAKTVTLVTDPAPVKNVSYVDRKALIAVLLRFAEENGAALVFGTEVLSPVCDETGVKGALVADKEGVKEIKADLVIDAAGIDSPLRRNLPQRFGVTREIAARDTYFVRRAYYSAKEGRAPFRPYTIWFFHSGAPGLDWLIRRENCADVLVGGIGGLEPAAADAAYRDLAAEYSFIGESIERGDTAIRHIPLRRTLGLFVADGYAAVGDAAAMTEPMNGSGITLSMKAGKILADTVIAGGEKGAAAENLWRYEYAYQKHLGEGFLTDDVLKGMLGSLTPADIDYLFETGVLTAREMLKDRSPVGVSYVLNKTRVFGRPSLFPAICRAAVRLSKLSALKRDMPRFWDRAAVFAWADRYESL